MDEALALETWVKNEDMAVLILVVMDEALALETWVKNEDRAVLILGVMDDALALQTTSVAGKTATGLNPCCNG